MTVKRCLLAIAAQGLLAASSAAITPPVSFDPDRWEASIPWERLPAATTSFRDVQYVEKAIRNPLNGHLYHLGRGLTYRDNAVFAELNWDQAWSFANSIGATLVTINDADEASWLTNAFPADPDSGNDFFIWTGGYSSGPDQWKWSSGETWQYANWHPDANVAGPTNRGVFLNNFGNPSGTWDAIPRSDAVHEGFPISALAETIPRVRELAELEIQYQSSACGEELNCLLPELQSPFEGERVLAVPSHWSKNKLVAPQQLDGSALHVGNGINARAETAFELTQAPNQARAVRVEVVTYANLTTPVVTVGEGPGGDAGESGTVGDFNFDRMTVSVESSRGQELGQAEFTIDDTVNFFGWQEVTIEDCMQKRVYSFPLDDVGDNDSIELILQHADAESENAFYNYALSCPNQSRPEELLHGGFEVNAYYELEEAQLTDVNLDGSLSIDDLSLLNDHLAQQRYEPLFDLDGDGQNTASDRLVLVSQIGANEIEKFSAQFRDGQYEPALDYDDDGVLTDRDLHVLVTDYFGTYVGDANLDGEFNSSDLVRVLSSGEYEDEIAGNSSWDEGDWDGDGDFSSSDLIAAFLDGGFEQGPRTSVSAVPEPHGIGMVGFGWLIVTYCQVRRRGDAI